MCGEERMRVEKSTTQIVIDIVYSHNCVKREEIVKELMRIVQKDKKTVNDRVTKVLKRLVEKGVIKRAGYAIYCKP
jgi:predicted transcriptional regulator